MLLRSLHLFFPSRKGRKMAHWQQFAHKPQTKKLKFCKIKKKDERDNTSMSAKGIMLLNPPESNCTNNYLALSKAFATMTHQVTHQVAHRVIAHGLFCKMRNIRSPYLASCGIVLFERNKRAKVFQGLHTAQQPRCTIAHTAQQLSQNAI